MLHQVGLKNHFILKMHGHTNIKFSDCCLLWTETLHRHKRPVQVKWHRRYYHYLNTPQCEVISTPPILFNFECCVTSRKKNQCKVAVTYSDILELLLQISTNISVMLNFVVQTIAISFSLSLISSAYSVYVNRVIVAPGHTQ